MIITAYLARLYAELLGSDAVLPDADAQPALDDWCRKGRAHWAFRVTDGTGEPVGFFTLAESFAFFADGVYGTLNELWIEPEHRS